MASIEFEFQGERREERGSRLFSASSDVTATVCDLSTTRDRSSAAKIELAEDALLEVETDDGAWLLTRQQYFALSNLDEEGNARNADGSRQAAPASGRRQLPNVVRLESGKRGLVSWVLKALRVLNIDLAGYLVSKAAKKIDASLVYNKQPGMYAVGRDGEMLRAPLAAGTEPALLLVHGTASSTLGAFGSLIPNESHSEYQRACWHNIHDTFKGRVYAFEHPTLTVPVAQNALDLLTALPKKDCPPLVMLSHSRGGLVSDTLASVQHAENHDEAFLQTLSAWAVRDGRDDSEEIACLQKLYQLAGERGSAHLPHVIRHVRVGCPAAGTSLAGPNTNIYLTVIAKLLDKIPDLPVLGFVIDIVEALFRLAAAVVKEGLKPGALPGIGSMKPDSTLVKLLDGMQSPSGELVVISGDASGVVDKILMPIFLGPHDWVVDTSSMRLGYRYEAYEEQALVGDGVSHTHYFERADVQARLSQELKPTARLAGAARGRAEVLSRGRVPGQSVQVALDQTCLFFLPGFMGSELSLKGSNKTIDVWVDYLRLLRGMGSELTIDNPDVVASGVLDKVYEDFLQYASQRVHVVPMAFDWRREIEAPVADFESLVSARLNASTMPVTIVCHSMGGLVARAWRQRYPKTWQRVVERGGFMLQGGTPNLGTWQVPKIFAGTHDFLRKMALFDLRNSLEDWQSWIAQFPGPAQMAVYDERMLKGSKLNLKHIKGWKQLGAGKQIPETPIRQHSAETAAARAEDGFAHDKRILYLAGVDKATPDLVENDGEWQLVDSPDGDGLALWSSAGKTPDFYIDAVHGNIFNHPDSFDSVLELALTGSTTGLSTSPPSHGSRGAAEAPAAQVRAALGLGHTPGLMSGAEQLLAAVTHGGGSSRVVAAKPVNTQLKVEVLHGNLMFCKAPVMVGHYAGDRIVRAEAALDSQLGGVLSQRWQLGPDFYTLGPGTNQVVLAPKNQNAHGPSGAIVVGLGRMGELTLGDLKLTVMRGVQRYLQTQLEAGHSGTAVPIAALLVGSGNEALKLNELLEGILKGVEKANEAFRNRDGLGCIAVGTVQFVEWHFDLALEARYALEDLKQQGDLKLQLKPGIQAMEGGMRRLWRKSSDQWWTSLSIEFGEQTEEEKTSGLERLEFSVGGQRAMGLSDYVLVSREEIERRLRPVFKGGIDNAFQAQQALFEQIVPHSFKRFAGQQRNLILELDPDAAFIPWELLVDRKSLDGKPMSVSAGLLRRLRPEADKPLAPKILSESRHALVVGNPPGARAGYLHLAGAVSEAEKVLEKIADAPRWKSKGLIYRSGADGLRSERQVISEILTGDYQILHVAAHGEYAADKPFDSGVVIGEEELADGKFRPLYLQPRHIRSLQLVPSLVFLNCCHTGAMEKWEGKHHLSASMAAEFMKAGVQVIVAASWEVGDTDALVFAESFYGSMLSGKPFGEAIRIARRAIHRDSANTWAAYQCYGDPGFTLPGVRGSNGSSNLNYQHVDELVNALQNIEVDLRAYRKNEKTPGTWVRSELARIEAAATQHRAQGEPKRWADLPKVVYALALAFGELGDWELAEGWLRRAWVADSSENSLNDMLRVRNYLVRLIERRAKQLEEADSVGSDEYFASYEDVLRIAKSLDSMNEVARESASLHRHRGAAWKLVAIMRQALGKASVARDADEKDATSALASCRDAYFVAYTLQRKSTEQDSIYYPGNNVLLLEGLIRLHKSKGAEPLKKSVLDELKSTVQARVEESSHALDPNVWAMVAKQDYDFACWVLDNNTKKAVLDEIATGVADALRNYGSDGQLDSMLKQLRFAQSFVDEYRAELVKEMIQSIKEKL